MSRFDDGNAASAERPSPPLTILFAVASGLAVANAYFAHSIIDVMADDIGLSRSHAGWIVAATQIGYGLGLILLVPLGDLMERRRLVIAQSALSVVAAGDRRRAERRAAPADDGGDGAPGRGDAVVRRFCGDPHWAARARARRRDRHQRHRPRHPAGACRRRDGDRSGGLADRLSRVGRRHPGDRRAARGDAAAWGPRFGRDLSGAHRLAVQAPADRAGVAYPRRHRAADLRQHHDAADAARAAAECAPFRYSHTEVGLFGLAGVAGALAASRAGRWADRGFGQRTTGIALTLMLVAWLPIGLLHWSIAWLVVGVVVIDFGLQAVHVTNQAMIYRVRPEAQSRLTAGYMVFYSAGSALGSAMSTLVYSWAGWTGVCVLGAGISALTLGFWALTLKAMPAEATAAH